MEIEFFTNSSQYKNTSIAYFVLAVPFTSNKTNEDYNLETSTPLISTNI